MREARKVLETGARKGLKRSPNAGGGVARGLWPKIAELRAEGRNAVQIGKEINRHPGTVSRTLQEPAIIADIERIQRDRRQALDQEIRAAASGAWGVLLELANDKAQPGSVRRSAACDILDRAGITAKTAIELSGPNGGPLVVAVGPADLAAMTPEQLRALSGVAVPTVIDAELVQEDDGPPDLADDG